MHYTRRNVISVFVVLAIAGPALGQSGWEDDGSIVHLTDSTDRVGIGTSTSAAKLTIANTTEHLRLVANSSIHDPWITSWDENEANRFWILKLGDRSNSNAFSIFSESEFSDVFTIKPDGNVGIGTASPSYPLDVAGEVMFRDMLVAKNTTNASVCKLQFDTSFQSVSNVWRYSISGSPTANGFALGFFDNVPNLWLSNNGNVGIGTTNPSEKLDVIGTVKMEVLKITGGSDLAEPFEVFDAEAAEPGMVVCIDPDRPGQLQVSTVAYDHKVAGIISGANGVNPGILMTQTGSKTGKEFPVALTGRVYAWADASAEPIRPGDLLTTSDTPGLAMKVTDYTRAQGATIGKAMSALEEGQGLVLVLVSLQ